MKKVSKFHHSVTENGTLQLRIITEYQDDEGNFIDHKYSIPETPLYPAVMIGWDKKSRDIVAAITDKITLTAFTAEKKEPTGIGPEEIITYDRTLNDFCRIKIRRITRIFDEGKEVSKKFHLSWINPGDDPEGNDVLSKAIAEKLHTPEVISAFNIKMQEDVDMESQNL